MPKLAALMLISSFCFGASVYEQNFEAMKADPANPEKSFRFAQSAIQSGDLHGAIAAFERMLLANPGLANIRLELGVLYLRVGATELASQNISQALRSPEVPSWVRSRAQGLLNKANRLASRNTFSGSLFLGLKHDSNANAAPSDRLVRVRGEDGLLDEDDTGVADMSTELSISLQHTFDLNSQAGHQFETALSSYNRFFDERTEINVNSLDLKTGPRFYFGPVLNPSWSLKPTLILSQLYLDGDNYLSTSGLGLSGRKSFSAQILAEMELSIEDQQYKNSAKRPNADERSGELYRWRSSVSYLLSPAMLMSAEIGFDSRESNADYESLQRGSLRLTTSYTYKNPFKKAMRPWRLSVALSLQQSDYDEADPLIDPTTKREDTRGDLSLSNSFPIGKAGSIIVSTQYTDNDSSLPNYDYDNWGASLGWFYNF